MGREGRGACLSCGRDTDVVSPTVLCCHALYTGRREGRGSAATSVSLAARVAGGRHFCVHVLVQIIGGRPRSATLAYHASYVPLIYAPFITACRIKRLSILVTALGLTLCRPAASPPPEGRAIIWRRGCRRAGGVTAAAHSRAVPILSSRARDRDYILHIYVNSV